MELLKKLSLSCLICLLLFACENKRPFEFIEVSVNDSYQIELPDFLQPANGMHPNASLQYENIEKELYLIVIDESKANMEAYDLDYDLEAYYQNLISKPFKSFVQNGSISIPARKDINGAKALIADIQGEVEGSLIFYKLAVIETANTFYQVVIWTRADQKDIFEADMLHVIESLKELSNLEEEAS